jgi:hypothetical protein
MLLSGFFQEKSSCQRHEKVYMHIKCFIDSANDFLKKLNLY